MSERALPDERNSEPAAEAVRDPVMKPTDAAALRAHRTAPAGMPLDWEELPHQLDHLVGEEGVESAVTFAICWSRRTCATRSRRLRTPSLSKIAFR
jgi:hypothetical protein